MKSLLAALLWLGSLTAAPAEPTMLGALSFSVDDDRFGGFSGIEVLEDGRSFIAVSDRGTFLTGRMMRDEGRITGLEDIRLISMRGPGGGGLREEQTDAEGLAVARDGKIYVSFEQDHRIWRYASPTEPAQPLSRHPDFATLQDNSSLEALAIGGDGALYTIPERSGRANRPFPVYRLRNGRWDIALHLPRRGAFLVVGADILDGQFYLLERDFTGFGFRTRVRRFDLALGTETTVLQTGSFRHDNLEGLSVWRGADGRIRLTMISDDNFRSFQRTEIVEYLLTQ